MLSVTFPHFTKNLDRLLRGYARLAPDLRAQVPLVLVFDPGPAGRLGFTGHLAHLGIDGDVVVTGIVSDRELAALYGGATVVVHPSRHEGFGLPVVEAMRCGAPVVINVLPAGGGGRRRPAGGSGRRGRLRPGHRVGGRRSRPDR